MRNLVDTERRYRKDFRHRSSGWPSAHDCRAARLIGTLVWTHPYVGLFGHCI